MEKKKTKQYNNKPLKTDDRLVPFVNESSVRSIFFDLERSIDHSVDHSICHDYDSDDEDGENKQLLFYRINRKNHRLQDTFERLLPLAEATKMNTKLEKEYVHSVYSRLATYQNENHNRSSPRVWPNVRRFVEDQDPGSIVVDVGGEEKTH
ncbi:hypothetical protein DICVIV_00711 [Dictyocaulus viviparus]|uniref:Uncharacterized protein n=1 Tax=Dictyocaulus viviparus TaxID=29172 RepID=A0A0D8YEG7_DICVI|nr:hypothetical protein DICVIV_00711 [Dictyocaulus viviparus]